ncbi:DUF6232 family protein [Aliikangiella coralliicola]|uniref:Uncharacterized protein n=1 Tax=Aliikangiella coralliicola TaxID=2592383 RepID=A0A545UIU9_9GAMM|nr:DUF6232 family protein [Aliikangiella coralliicola]TQV89387.1 hypothetical protein FLL46_00450 [Aliikangiella coralliicola]
MIDKDKEDVLKVGKLVIYKNALIYQNSVIQISNICSVWVADQSYVIQHSVPGWVKILGIIGGLLVFLSLSGKGGIFLLVGLILVVAAIVGYVKHKPSTPISKYALGVERASGRIMFFSARDKGFVKKMARTLVEAISDTKETSEAVVMNFDNKSINIESVTGSNIVGGDVVDSLVESKKNDGY